MHISFKSEYPFEDRKTEGLRVKTKYPDRIPLICEKNKFASKDTPNIDKHKYLVPNDLTVGQLMYVIRKRLKLPPEKALFLFVGNSIASASSKLIDMYNFYSEEDHF